MCYQCRPKYLYHYAFSFLSLAACLLAISGCGPTPASQSEPLLLPQWASLRLEETKFYQIYTRFAAQPGVPDRRL
jgi:hypothetical protein